MANVLCKSTEERREERKKNQQRKHTDIIAVLCMCVLNENHYRDTVLLLLHFNGTHEHAQAHRHTHTHLNPWNEFGIDEKKNNLKHKIYFDRNCSPPPRRGPMEVE